MNKIILYFINQYCYIYTYFQNLFYIKDIHADYFFKTINYSIFYFNILNIFYSRCYILFLILYKFHPLKNNMDYVITYENGFIYKKIIHINSKTQYKEIFNFETNSIDDYMFKCVELYDNNNKIYDIKSYFIDSKYQTLNNIIYDLSCTKKINLYGLIKKIKYLDVLTEEEQIKYVNNKINLDTKIIDLF